MVTEVSGSTPPPGSVTVPVMPPRVCCASAHTDNATNAPRIAAIRKRPRFIFFAIVQHLVRDFENRNPQQPSRPQKQTMTFSENDFLRKLDAELVNSAPGLENYFATLRELHTKRKTQA